MEDSNLLAFQPEAATQPEARPAFRPLPALLSSETRQSRLIAAALVCAFAVAYFWFIFQYWAPAHNGVDQNGYLVGGRMLAQSGTTGFLPKPMEYVGDMWVLNDKTGWVYPKYPVGLPLLYAVCLWTCGTLGTKAAFLVSPVGAALAVLGIYFLTRKFAGTFASLMAMLVLAFGQVTLVLANNPNSHASCLAFGIWGMFFLIAFWETGSVWRGLVGGFCLGYAVTIRYTEGLMGLMIGAAVLGLVWHINKRAFGLMCVAIVTLATAALIKSNPTAGLVVWLAEKKAATPMIYAFGVIGLLAGLAGVVLLAWRDARLSLRVAAPVLGWMIPVAYLVGFNLVAMGTLTGYDTTNESEFGAAFTMDHVAQNWEKTLRQLHDLGLFFVLPLGLLGMGLALRDGARRGGMLWLWFVPGTLLYTSYYWAPERGVSYLRFFLTLLPPIIVGLGVLIDQVVVASLTRWQRVVAPAACGLVVAVACVNSLYRGLLGIEEGQETGVGMESQFRQQVNLAGLTDVVTRQVPNGSILISAGGMGRGAPLNMLQFAGDYECYNNGSFNANYAASLRGRGQRMNPEDADPIQAQLRDYKLKQVDGKTDKQLEQMQTEIVTKALADGRRAFVVCTKAEVPLLMRKYESKALGTTWKVVGSYHDLPKLRADDATPNAQPQPPGRPNGNARRNGVVGGPPNRRGQGGGFRMAELPTQVWQVIEIKRV